MSVNRAPVEQDFGRRLVANVSGLGRAQTALAAVGAAASQAEIVAFPSKDAPLQARKRSLALKRALDMVVALCAIVALAPLMAAIATLIWLEDRGPVLFRQTRGGFQGKSFSIYKFRTMSTLEDGPVVTQATRNDPRVTRIGAFLRKSSLDELPQLVNVLRGDMSLVGPRPHAVAHDEYYGARIEAYQRRFAVRPGITGLAQVSNCRGETRALEDMERRVMFDAEYAERCSLLMDLKILVRTAGMVFGHAKAY